MLYEFEIIYRESEAGELKRFALTAETDEKAKEFMQQQELIVERVTELRPVVDFQRLIWNRDELAAAMGIKPATLSAKLGTGEIPWNAKIAGVERDVALQYIRKGYNQAGKTIHQELAA